MWRLLGVFEETWIPRYLAPPYRSFNPMQGQGELQRRENSKLILVPIHDLGKKKSATQVSKLALFLSL